MLKIIFPLIIIVHIAQSIFAQEFNLKEIYTKNVIALYRGEFIRNDQKLKYKEVEPLLLGFPDSAKEFQLYKSNNNSAGIIGLVGVATMITGWVAANNNHALAEVTTLAALGFFTISASFRGKGRMHLQKSLWFYNRDILVEKY